MAIKNDERLHPRKGINIRKTTTDLLDKFCQKHKVSRTGLLEELSTALIMGDTRFFTVIPHNQKELAYLHPSKDTSWDITVQKVKDLVDEFDYELFEDAPKGFYQAAEQVGVSRKQADRITGQMLNGEIKYNEEEDESGG